MKVWKDSWSIINRTIHFMGKKAMFSEYLISHFQMPSTVNWKQSVDFSQFQNHLERLFLNFIPNPISEQHTDFNFANAVFILPHAFGHKCTKSWSSLEAQTVSLLLSGSAFPRILPVVLILGSLLWFQLSQHPLSCLLSQHVSLGPTEAFQLLNSPSDRMLILKIMRSYPWRWIFEVRIM